MLTEGWSSLFPIELTLFQKAFQGSVAMIGSPTIDTSGHASVTRRILKLDELITTRVLLDDIAQFEDITQQ